METKPSFLREFDLAYWQMREALGYPIPNRIDQRFPKKLSGNGGHNPFQCGPCAARKLYPATNLSCDVLANRRRLTGDERREFEERITEALIEQVSQ
jgi:hypothetical protein